MGEIRADIDRKTSGNQGTRHFIEQPALTGRHCSTARPDNAISRPPAQVLECQIERLCLQIIGKDEQTLQLGWGNCTDESQCQMQAFAADATPTTTFARRGSGGLQRIKRDRIRPECKEYPPRRL
jgi:hypothetical protein